MAYSFDVANKLRLFEQDRQAAEQCIQFLRLQDRVFNVKHGRSAGDKSRVVFKKRFDLHTGRIAVPSRP
ncbi:MAG TPA: hypothetical protein VK797_11420 [Tepidisphaeraceae bacterium]|jgi:hypothetical protein|nr:hypothetical protein [Tepidisphaeraceae bacterium]